MLRMPSFEVHRPRTAEEAVRLVTELPSARFVAGGTDLLPNLKHHLESPAHLVALGGVEGLQCLEDTDDGWLSIGAGCSLHQVANNRSVAQRLAALAVAAGCIAGPQHRRMGTLGGNVLLDTRCLFYNQTRAWRQALGSCLKAEGSWCHVIGSAKGCVAAQSSDTVPVLVAADARLRLMVPGDDGAPSTEHLPIRALYGKDGRRDQMHQLRPGTLLCAIELPPGHRGLRSVYRKVRSRGAVDFPQLGVAAVGRFTDDRRCEQLAVVLGASFLSKSRQACSKSRPSRSSNTRVWSSWSATRSS